MTNYAEECELGDYEGFQISVKFEPDYTYTQDDLGDDKETIRAVNSGELEVYNIEVIASKAGIELGHDYLGLNISCYDQLLDDFISNGYKEDMISNALEEARDKIRELLS